MNGKMNDAAGMVWTYLAKRTEPCSFYEICTHLIAMHWINDLARGLQFWIDNDEVLKDHRDDGGIYYYIKDRVCPLSESHTASNADSQPKQRSKQGSRSGTRSVGKRGSATAGRKHRRKVARR